MECGTCKTILVPCRVVYECSNCRKESPESVLQRVTRNPLLLRTVPESEKSKELCNTALKLNSRVLEYIPTQFLDSASCLAAVRKQPVLLKFVPEEYKTLEMSQVAVAYHGVLLQFVPLKFRNVLSTLALESHVAYLFTTPEFRNHYPNPLV